MTEIWKKVPGFKGVYASNKGRIGRKDYVVTYATNRKQSSYKQTRKGGIVAKWFHKPGQRFFVTVEGKDIGVGRLVCMAFKGLPPNNKPYACHENGDPLDDSENNLYWGSQQENMDDKIRHGTVCNGERNGSSKLTKDQAQAIYDRNIQGETGKSLALEYGISRGSVCDIAKGRTWPEIDRSHSKS